MTIKQSVLLVWLAGCNIGPRVKDAPDAAPPPDARPDVIGGFTDILPPGTVPPSIGTDPAALVQIKLNDGLVDATLMTNNNVVVRSVGKSNGVTVNYWNFGPSPTQDGFAVAAPLYIFGRMDAGVFTPLANHPPMIEAIPGDTRYSPIHKVLNVPVTTKYNGEVIATIAALGEALDKGLVEDPVPDGTWVNMPVVLPGVMLEVSTGVTIPAKQVYGKGYTIDVFELGTSLGRQPFRSNLIPIGQASGLQTGVPSGNPPTLPLAVDPQLVFQFVIPTVPPGTMFSYTPLCTDVTVRLASGVAPSGVTSDAQMFKRSATGAMLAFDPAFVANFTVQTTTNDLQLQFMDGVP